MKQFKIDQDHNCVIDIDANEYEINLKEFITKWKSYTSFIDMLHSQGTVDQQIPTSEHYELLKSFYIDLKNVYLKIGFNQNLSFWFSKVIIKYIYNLNKYPSTNNSYVYKSTSWIYNY